LRVDNKKPATQKAKREQWHDADTPEAQAILATKSPKKSRKNDSVGSPIWYNQRRYAINALLEALAGASK
jgi:hypothetical protein